MAKLERLLALARMTKDRRVTNIREMSRVCGVSQRTVYRYLNTLADVSLTDSLLSGAESGISTIGKDALSADDRCLIRYALDHNPLSGQSFFAGRFGRLGLTLAPTGNPTGRRLRGQVFEVALKKAAPSKSPCDRWLTLFEQARLSGKMLKVVTRTTGVGHVLLSPNAIKLKGEEVQLRFKDPATGRFTRLRLDQIVSIRIGPSVPRTRSRRR